MTITAAEAYAARFDARKAQDDRIFGEEPQDRWSPLTQGFRRDPRRELDGDAAVIASYVQPEDVVLDVGGGAGRIALPLALRCREVINVEPSPAMGAAFEALREEVGITNAHLVQADWVAAEGIEGDLSIIAYVTYFVRDIVPFIEKLVAASRRRVLIAVDSVPPPDQGADLFRFIHQEESEAVPGYRELLPVLWEMGILPEVRVLPGRLGGIALPQTREEMVDRALGIGGRRPEVQARARSVIEAHFDEFFVYTPEGFRRRGSRGSRLLLITWQTAGGER